MKDINFCLGRCGLHEAREDPTKSIHACRGDGGRRPEPRARVESKLKGSGDAKIGRTASLSHRAVSSERIKKSKHRDIGAR